jgi:hypothetical protein
MRETYQSLLKVEVPYDIRLERLNSVVYIETIGFGNI